MLGFSINIWRPIDPPDTPAHKRRGFIGGWAVAGSWSESLGWLEKLVTEGCASNLGGNGYPLSYKIMASILVETLRSGLHRPGPGGSVIIGEDYITRSGTVTDFEIDWVLLDECLPDEELFIEAWDLS
jgi:hypothetical protein